jgi:hypothetical protein
MIHEEIHSSRQWYRLFPRSNASHVYRTFADSPQVRPFTTVKREGERASARECEAVGREMERRD